MAATLTFGEGNHVGEDQTNSLANMNFGSVDDSDLVYASNPIDAGTFSFDKWFYIFVSNMDTSNLVDNFRVAMSGTIDAETSYFSNLDGTLLNPTYNQPSNASKDVLADQDMTVNLPGSENLGVSGGSGGITTASNKTDYFLTQLEVSGAAAPGDLTQKTFHALYDES